MKSRMFVGISCATLGLVTLPAIGQSITDPTNPKYRPKTADDQANERNQSYQQYNRQPDYRDNTRDRDPNARTGGVREVQPGNTQWDRDDRNRWNNQDQRGGQSYNQNYNQNTYDQNNQNRYTQNYGQTSSAGMLSQMAGTWRVDVRMNPSAWDHMKGSSTRSDWDGNLPRNSQSRNNTNPNNPQGGIDGRHQNRNTDPTNITSSTNPGNPNDRPIGNTNTTTNTNWNNNNNNNLNNNVGGADSKTAYATADLIMNGNILRQVLVCPDMNSSSGDQWRNDMNRTSFGQDAFRGISYLSFDEQSNQYNAAFMDSMSGSLHVSQGTYDSGNRRITLESQTDDSAKQASGKNKEKRVVIEFLDNDRYQVTMYKDAAGKSTTTSTGTNRNVGGSLPEDVVYIATYTRATGSQIPNINRGVYQDQMLFPNGRGMNRDNWNRDNWNRDDTNRDNWNRDNWNRDGMNRDSWNRDDMNRDNWNRDNWNRDDTNRDNWNRDNWNRDDTNRDNWNRDDTNRDDWNRDQRRNQGTTPGSTNPGNPR